MKNKRFKKVGVVIAGIILVMILSSMVSFASYENHCWQCGEHISSTYCRQCPECGWYICVNCGACAKACPLCFNHDGSSQYTEPPVEQEPEYYEYEPPWGSSEQSSNSSSVYDKNMYYISEGEGSDYKVIRDGEEASSSLYEGQDSSSASDTPPDDFFHNPWFAVVVLLIPISLIALLVISENHKEKKEKEKAENNN